MAANAKAIIVHAKSQASAGVAPTLTVGTDHALRVYQRPTPTIVGEGLIERADALSPFGPGLKPVKGSVGYEVTLMTEWIGFASNDDLTTSPLGPLWNSCGIMTEDPIVWEPSRIAARGFTAGTLVPFTLWIDEVGGNRYQMIDCHAIPTLTVEAGQRGMISWSVRGRYVTPVTSSITPGDVTYGSDLMPIVGVNVGITGGAELTNTAVQRFEFRTGLAFVDRPDVVDNTGLGPVFLDWAESPAVAFTADSGPEGTFATWADVFGAVAQNLDFTFSQAATGDCVIALPAAYLRVPTLSGDAFSTYDLEAFGTPAASDKSLTITFQD